MLIHGDTYFATVQQALKAAEKVAMAVAFWGDGAEKMFNGWHGTSSRLICNLALGGTNPDAIVKLQQLPNTEVRHLSDLHAKLIVTENHVIVGSANASANGLGLEAGEIAGWREAGIASTEAALVQSAEDWFEGQWASSKPITPSDLKRAKTEWEKRRHVRPRNDTSKSFMEQTAESLKDRPIYFVIYRHDVSERASEELSRVKQQTNLARAGLISSDQLDVFEGWNPDELPSDPNASLIQVFWGGSPLGKIAVVGVWQPVPGLQSTYDSDSETVRLDFVVRQTSVGSWSFTQADQRKLKKELKPWLEQLELPDEHGRCVPAYEFRLWQRGQATRVLES
jgi:hypothetical protein